MKIIFILTVITAISASQKSSVEYLKSSEYCAAVQTGCKGIHDSSNNYRVDCQDLCHENYPNLCGPKLCSINELACEQFKQQESSLDPFFKTIYDEINLIKFKFFRNRIQPCPIRKNWKSSEICLNIKKCTQIQPTRLRASSVYFVTKETECPCTGNHTYYCEPNICSANKYACNGFQLKHKNNQQFKLLGLKSCATV